MIALALAMSLSAAPLSDATKRYADLDYEGCVGVLAPELSKLHGPVRASAELYFGLCHFALGHEAEARRHLEAALRLDSNVLPPASSSPKERQLFDEVARSVAANPKPLSRRSSPRHADAPVNEPAPADTASAPEPEPPAEAAPAVEPVVVPAPVAPPPAVDAAATPDAKPRSYLLPVTLAVATAVAAATGAGFGFAALQAQSGSRAEAVQVPAGALLQQAQQWALVANVCFGVAGAAAVGAVVSWLWIHFSAG